MEEFVKTVIRVVALFVAAGFGLTFLLGVLWTIRRGGWLGDIAQRQYAALIGLPFAALAAFCVVVILEAGYGQITMDGLGFTFRGAAAPAIIWIFAFLAIASAIKLVWQKDDSGPPANLRSNQDKQSAPGGGKGDRA
jgi:hypothetical protein